MVGVTIRQPNQQKPNKLSKLEKVDQNSKLEEVDQNISFSS